MFLIIAVVLWSALVWSLIDIARRPAAAFVATGVSKSWTVVLVLFTGGIGAVYYLLRVRATVAAATDRIAPAELRPDTKRDYRQWKHLGRDPWS